MMVKTIGREYQHPEDLVFTEPRGALRAQYILKNIQSVRMTVKWDGNPTIYFGRDAGGKFTLVGKNGWGREWIGSVDELITWNMSRGRQEGWRARFSEDLARLWRIIENNFPETERGFYYADVLWHPGNTYDVDGKTLSFTPNKTTYVINQDSALAEKILKSSVGLAIHKRYDAFDKRAYGRPVVDEMFTESAAVVAMSQTQINGPVAIDPEKIKELDELLDENRYLPVNQFLFEKRTGLSDFREIIYTYTNRMVKTGRIDQISNLDNFRDWLKESTVSFNKQGKIDALCRIHADKISAMFDIYMLVMEIKDDIIHQVDQNNRDFKTTVGGKPGSEGYITTRYHLKFVPRRQWIPD
jgi:hypothetical protein